MDMSTLKRINEYDKCLELPIKLLNNVKNIKQVQKNKTNIIKITIFFPLVIFTPILLYFD